MASCSFYFLSILNDLSRTFFRSLFGHLIIIPILQILKRKEVEFLSRSPLRLYRKAMVQSTEPHLVTLAQTYHSSEFSSQNSVKLSVPHNPSAFLLMASCVFSNEFNKQNLTQT